MFRALQVACSIVNNIKAVDMTSSVNLNVWYRFLLWRPLKECAWDFWTSVFRSGYKVVYRFTFRMQAPGGRKPVLLLLDG